MSPELTQCIELHLQSLDSRNLGPIAKVGRVGGGCINEAYRVTLHDGPTFMVKANRPDRQAMFESEAEGLNRLARSEDIRIPEVVACGACNDASYLVLEWIDSSREALDYQQQLGRRLAALHQNQQQTRFGLDADNYLGSSVQPNEWSERWVSFWAEHRIGFQLKLAKQNGYDGGGLIHKGNRLVNRMDRLLAGPDEPAVLIHGDLWSGNHLADELGRPVLIDPAVYYAHREAEFGMTTLFGGFDDSFYGAYNEVWPLADGYSQRVEIYRLYHLLNHLNLFGSGYLSGCLEILNKYE